MNILFISLGCDKNLVDSEVMLGILAKDGHQMVDDETMADVIIINTCCFIHDAKEESIQNILEMADLKKTGRLKALIVTGCLAQRYKEEIIQEIPEVDAVLGTTSYEEIAHVIDGVLSDSPMERGDVRLTMKDVDYLPVTDTHRMVTTGGHFAYLKIAEGCDKHCTYCIIPKVRGEFSECADGASAGGSAESGRRRGEGADPGSTGDHHVRNRSVRGEAASTAFESALQDQRTSLDPYFILLSGGNHG